MRRTLLALITAGLLAMSLAAPAAAVTKGGTVDSANQYPYVGLMVAYVYDEATKTYVPSWRCTGTLVSPELFITAGHCTDGADWVEIWFDWDVTDAAAEGYPYYGEGDAGGTPYTHPDYDPNAFYTHDLGVVVLKGKEAYETPNDTYATLPRLDQVGMLDGLAVGTVFTTVGYGLHTAYPDGTPADEKEDASRLRMIAKPRLLQYVSDPNAGNFALHFGSNSKTGGTCFGDSGGPTFYNGVLVGVTSFAYTETCAGRDGIYRLDQADDLNWLYGNFAQYM